MSAFTFLCGLPGVCRSRLEQRRPRGRRSVGRDALLILVLHTLSVILLTDTNKSDPKKNTMGPLSSPRSVAVPDELRGRSPKGASRSLSEVPSVQDESSIELGKNSWSTLPTYELKWTPSFHLDDELSRKLWRQPFRDISGRKVRTATHVTRRPLPLPFPDPHPLVPFFRSSYFTVISIHLAHVACMELNVRCIIYRLRSTP